MSKFHNIVLLIILSITSTVYADKSYDIFIEGCHLNNPISNQNNWHGIYKYNLNGKISYKLLKVKLSTSKKIDKIDGLIDFCVKSNQIKDAEKVQKNSGVLIKSSFLEEKFIEAAHLTKFSFNELSKIGRDYDRNFPRTEESIKIKLGDLEYILNQTTNLNDNAVGPNHTLTLSHNNISQILFNKHGNYEGTTDFYIIWAGDMDGDKKLDLLVNLPEHYASPYHLRLYLSSFAKEGNHLSQVKERLFFTR